MVQSSSARSTARVVDGQRDRVIVVGAGLAGVSAARALHDRSYRVVVLEGQDHIGGRCYTVDGLDYGAHWIHSTEGNPISNLARRLSLPMLFVGGDSTYVGGWEHLALFGPGGEPLDAEQKLHCILLADQVKDELEAMRIRMVRAGQSDISLQHAIGQVLRGKAFDVLDQRAVDWHLMGLARDDWSSPPDELSFLYADESYEVYGYGDSVLQDGYQPLVERLAAGLDIRINERVERIEYGDRHEVRVVTSTGQYAADRVIVTVPLGVLKAEDIAFDPPLPAWKRHAIACLGWGSLAKVFVRFAAPFWPPEQYAFGYMCREVETYPTDIINLYKTHGLPVLVLMLGGQHAHELEQWSEVALEAWVMTVLRDVFGDKVPAPVALSRTTWGQDPCRDPLYGARSLGHDVYRG